jgi:hypothetical protein
MSNPNITQVLTNELKRLRKEGFNGVRFSECYMAEDLKALLKDWLNDGWALEQFEDHCANYCIVKITPDFNEDDCRSTGSKYMCIEIDFDGFYDDLIKHLKKVCGGDVHCVGGYNDGELEITRIGYQWPIL